MIIRARAVVTMDGAPIMNGAVALTQDTMTDVGAWHEVARRNTGEVVDLGERALLPGLINAHGHLDYTGLRGAIPPPDSFTEWIKTINARKAASGEEDYLRSIEAGLEEAARFGTTTIANLEAFPQLIPRVSAHSMRVLWFAELIDARGEISPPPDLSLAPHAPYTASAKLYRAAASRVLATTHLAESREEMAMFRDASGPLFDFMKSIGRPMEDCGRVTPLQLVLGWAVLDERWTIAHLNELAEDDVDRLEHAPRFHIAHCPRSHAYFGHRRFEFAKLKALGFNICIATDSLASNSDLSLFAELRHFRKNEALPARDLLKLVTVNPAKALRQEAVLGRLRPGFLADLIAVPFTGREEFLLDEVLEFDDAVPWSMLGGQVRTP